MLLSYYNELIGALGNLRGNATIVVWDVCRCQLLMRGNYHFVMDQMARYHLPSAIFPTIRETDQTPCY